MIRLARASTVPVAALCLLAAAPQSPDRGQIQERLNQATDLLNRNAYAEVLQLLEPLVGEPVARDSTLAETHYAIATAYYRLTRYSEALQHYERALEGERQLHDRASEARTLRAVAQLHKNRGAYAQGIAVSGEALSLYRALGDDRGLALTEIGIGSLRDLTGDHRGALESYQRALPVFGDENSGDAARLMYEIGITYKNLGNYAEAQRYYSRALDDQVALKDTNGQVFTLLNIGNLYNTLGEVDRAVSYSEEALRLARQVANRRAESILLLNLGEFYWRLGQPQRALGVLEQELPLARAQGARSEENLTLVALGDIQAVMGNPVLARQNYDEALRIEREIGERRTEASTLAALAELALREGSGSEALRFAEQALSLARETERPEVEWNARRLLARADAANGRTAPAIDELRASARIINDLRANVTSDADKIAFVDRRQDVFQDLATLLVESGRAEDALEAAEAGRARAFADLLAQRQILGKPAEQDALAQIRIAQTELQAALEPLSAPIARSAARTRGGELLDRRVNALRVEHRELASLLTAESPTVGDISATAARLNAWLVEYLVTDRRLMIWVIPPRGTIQVATVDVTREHLEGLTRSVREAIDKVDDRAPGRSTPLRSSLRELHGLLVAPVAKWLPSSSDDVVVVIPHGPLALLPFAALEDAHGLPLAARHTLSYAPAASVYLHTQDKARARPNRVRRALIVADPIPPAGSGVERLPWAREEGQRVADRLRGTPVTVLSGADASERVVKRDAGAYSFLHFATHGLVAPDRPLASSLLLGADEGDDGYLRVDEIFNLDLAAELVVLSGCSTGLGGSLETGLSV